MKRKNTRARTKRATKAPAATKGQQRKRMITTLAVGATGILGYFGWQYYRKHRAAKHNNIDTILQNMEQPIVLQPTLPTVRPRKRAATTTGSAFYTTTGDEFPLQKGSKGQNVKRLQEALITKYGSSVLPKWGADGDFGSELAAALKKLGLPDVISESTFNVIVQGTAANPSTIGKDLYNAAITRDYNKVIALLKKLKSVNDYTAANEIFKQNRIGDVRQTIVNGMLTVFSSDAQKQAIKLEFLRMGLQFDGSKWSLSGFDGQPIITVAPTSVWVNASDSVTVPAQMVLGNEVSRRLDYTLFENGGKHFLVQTKNVKYL